MARPARLRVPAATPVPAILCTHCAPSGGVRLVRPHRPHLLPLLERPGQSERSASRYGADPPGPTTDASHRCTGAWSGAADADTSGTRSGDAKEHHDSIVTAARSRVNQARRWRVERDKATHRDPRAPRIRSERRAQPTRRSPGPKHAGAAPRRAARDVWLGTCGSGRVALSWASVDRGRRDGCRRDRRATQRTASAPPSASGGCSGDAVHCDSETHPDTRRSATHPVSQ